MIRSETALGNALRKVGFVPRQMRLIVALREFMDSGGTREEWIAVYDAERELRGDGRSRTGKYAHPKGANAAQTNGGGGPSMESPTPDQAHGAASLPPKADMTGQVHAGKAARLHVAPTVREPTPSQIAAELAMKRASAQSVFDRETTSWGKQWGNVYYRDLDNMHEDGDIATALKKHIGSLRGDDRHKTIRDLMTPREFAQLINKVRKHAA